MKNSQDKKDSPENNESENQMEKRLRQIHTLANRLPWIAVGVMLLSLLCILLEVLYKRNFG